MKKNKKIKSRIIKGSFIAAAFFFIFSFGTNAFADDKVISLTHTGKDSGITNLRREPVISENYETIKDINSEYAVILDADENILLAGKGCRRRVFPASLTKVMTLLTAVDFISDINKEYAITQDILSKLYAAEASVAGYGVGEKIKASDMLYGLILPSGADAAMGLAELTAGSMETFAGLMNIEAFKMGLSDTHFTNTTGLHDKNNYSTPLDLAVIFEYALDNELCRKVLSTPVYKNEPNNYHPEGLELFSHTFTYMSGIDMGDFKLNAGKTGYTGEAMVCMMTEAEKNGHHYIVVTLYARNSKTMSEDHVNLYKKYAK